MTRKAGQLFHNQFYVTWCCEDALKGTTRVRCDHSAPQLYQFVTSVVRTIYTLRNRAFAQSVSTSAISVPSRSSPIKSVVFRSCIFSATRLPVTTTLQYESTPKICYKSINHSINQNYFRALKNWPIANVVYRKWPETKQLMNKYLNTNRWV